VDAKNGRKGKMGNIIDGMIVVLVSFMVGTIVCGMVFLVENIIIWNGFLREISGEKQKILADAVLHIIIFSIGFGLLYAMYKAGV
jgi:cytochrome c biogenesis protein ResB